MKDGKAWTDLKNPTYRVWTSLKDRKICPPEWDDFDNFLADMGAKPPDTSLRKKDPLKPHGPNNSHWKLHNSVKAYKRPELPSYEPVRRESRLDYLYTIQMGKRISNLYRCKTCGCELKMSPDKWYRQTWFPCQHQKSVCPQVFVPQDKRIETFKATTSNYEYLRKAKKAFANAVRRKDMPAKFHNLDHFLATVGLPKFLRDRLVRLDPLEPHSPTNTFWLSAGEIMEIREKNRLHRRGPAYTNNILEQQGPRLRRSNDSDSPAKDSHIEEATEAVKALKYSGSRRAAQESKIHTAGESLIHTLNTGDNDEQLETD